MKKIMLLILSLFSLLILTGQSGKINSGGLSSKYLGSYYKGNYVWGGAMNLCWNELNENILKGNLQLNTNDKVALRMVETLNNPVFTKKDLDDKSYYVKSGYGQKTVDLINNESKKKFPDKSFGDLDLNLGPTDIISYAYFLKKVEYVNVFEKSFMLFENKKVNGFSTNNEAQRNTVLILNYENDDKFIVSLKLKDEEDQLILAKGYEMSKPDEIVKTINSIKQNKIIKMKKNDFFSAPIIQVELNRKYQELINKNLLNKDFESYKISEMFENIKFDMDEKGARAENEAVIVLSKSMILDDETPKNLILNKPYWIIMKRKDSQNPYFILGVNNTEIMTKK